MGTEAETTTGNDFGPHLRQSRERSGLSLVELSRVTRIPQATLEALESERLERLPPPTYVRGFIRVYARAVRTPEVEPLARYERAATAARVSADAAAHLAEGGDTSSGRSRWIVFAVLVLLGLVGAGFALWRV
jgi:cytoskeleton protein RodZ